MAEWGECRLQRVQARPGTPTLPLASWGTRPSVVRTQWHRVWRDGACVRCAIKVVAAVTVSVLTSRPTWRPFASLTLTFSEVNTCLKGGPSRACASSS